MSKKSVEERFWSKVIIRNSDECWEWSGAKNPKGYGEFWNNLRDSHTRAHQVSWILSFGEIPEGMLVCHTCDNPRCVNPTHLFLGTSQDNTQDMLDKDRKLVGRIYSGKSHPQHGTNSKHNKLTENDVLEIISLYETQKPTFPELARKFGVSAGLISNIIHGRKWAWLTGR